MLQYIGSALSLLNKFTANKKLTPKSAATGVLLFLAMLLVGKYFTSEEIDSALDSAEEIQEMMEQNDESK